MSVPANGAALTLMRKPEQKGKIPQGSHPRSNNMKQHVPEEFSTRLIGSPLVIMGNTVPPRDPDEDEEDEEEEDEENNADEPAVVREPDED
jgi:hypothetical protein